MLTGLTGACVAALLGRLFWVFDLAAHFMVFYLIVAVVLVIAFSLLRCWRTVAVCAGLLIFVVVQVGPYLLPGRVVEEADVKDGTYRFVAFNLLRNNTEVDAVREFLENESADVLLLQEVTPRWVRHLKASMDEMYPHQILQERNHAFGIWLLSKHPWTNAEMLPSPEVETPFVSAEIDLGGTVVYFVGVHTLPPVGQSKARNRNEWMERVGKLIGEKDGARIVMGDLNCTPWSPHFRKLLRDGHLADASRGWKYQPTWESGFSWLAIPIDHCLVSEDIAVLRRSVGPDIGSDHRAVTVDVAIED